MSFLIRVAVLAAALPSSAFGLQDIDSRSPLPLPTTDSVSPAVRQSRDRLFAGFLSNFPNQVDEPAALLPMIFVHAMPMPELPFAKAQIILIGNVDSLTARLMPGSQGVYTEYRITISQLIVNKLQWNKPQLDVLQLGGFVQLSGGRVIGNRLQGVGNQIDQGGTYLMFLNYQPTADCFTIVKMWAVRNGLANAMANDDLGRVKNNVATVNGTPIGAVISRIQAIAASIK